MFSISIAALWTNRMSDYSQPAIITKTPHGFCTHQSQLATGQAPDTQADAPPHLTSHSIILESEHSLRRVYRFPMFRLVARFKCELCRYRPEAEGAEVEIRLGAAATTPHATSYERMRKGKVAMLP